MCGSTIILNEFVDLFFNCRPTVQWDGLIVHPPEPINCQDFHTDIDHWRIPTGLKRKWQSQDFQDAIGKIPYYQKGYQCMYPKKDRKLSIHRQNSSSNGFPSVTSEDEASSLTSSWNEERVSVIDEVDSWESSSTTNDNAPTTSEKVCNLFSVSLCCDDIEEFLV